MRMMGIGVGHHGDASDGITTREFRVCLIAASAYKQALTLHRDDCCGIQLGGGDGQG